MATSEAENETNETMKTKQALPKDIILNFIPGEVRREELVEPAFTVCLGTTAVADILPGENAEEYATIFAAAPELLSALETAITWMDILDRQTGPLSDGPLRAAIDQARAAIAKAK